MKKKIVWLGMSWLIVAALVLASCGPAAPEGEEEEEEEEEEEGVATLSIGETFQSSEVVVTISELIVTDSYEYYDEASESTATEEASPGMSFLIITVKIENVSNRRRRLEGEKRFSISDSEGNTYLYHQYLGENPILTPPYLHVGDEIEGKMLFNIPEGTSGLKIAYTSKTPPTENKLLAEWVIE